MLSKFCCLLSAWGVALFCLCSCGERQDYAPDQIVYHPNTPYSAKVVHGKVIPPKEVPPQVKRAIAAANKISGKPYRRGGGHGKHDDSAYDCSGSIGYVLRSAGLMVGSRPSTNFLRYGRHGYGKWITIYAKSGHVFMTICGVRFDTGGSGGRGESGPAWRTNPRSGKGFVMRHPYPF